MFSGNVIWQQSLSVVMLLTAQTCCMQPPLCNCCSANFLCFCHVLNLQVVFCFYNTETFIVVSIKLHVQLLKKRHKRGKEIFL
jgi:hypothetical protein